MASSDDSRHESRHTSTVGPDAHTSATMPMPMPPHTGNQEQMRQAPAQLSPQPQSQQTPRDRFFRRSSFNNNTLQLPSPAASPNDEYPTRLRRASIRLMRTPSAESTTRSHGFPFPAATATQAATDNVSPRRRSHSEPRPVAANLSSALVHAHPRPDQGQGPQQEPYRLVRKSSELGTSAVHGPGTRTDAASELYTVLENRQSLDDGNAFPKIQVAPKEEPRIEIRDAAADRGRGDSTQEGLGLLRVPEPAATRNRPHRSLSGLSSSPFRRNRASTLSGPLQGSDVQRRRSRRVSGAERQPHPDEIDGGIVNLLDAIDPEVSTLTTLTNVQNSLFVPNLGSFLNRRPTYIISRSSSSTDEEQGVNPPAPAAARGEGESRGLDEAQTWPAARRQSEEEEEEEEEEAETERTSTHTSDEPLRLHRTRTEYMILPDGVNVDGWTEAEKAQLNDHVRHMLHSKRSAFRRGLKGFIKYVSKPLGFLVTLYAVLITLFGLAWVLFLIGWINVGGRQLYIINVIDNVLVALFAIMGDGLAPFRAVDTYHMIFIAHYGKLTWKRRKALNLKKLKNKNDLPTTHGSNLTDLDADPEIVSETPDQELSVLTLRQQERLMHHQQKFAKSHTFYKPHETGTHYAFPLNLLIAIVVLLDLHSCFQIALGTCTWSIYYKRRPFALTTVILCCSIACNITAGILIWVGDRKSRKVEVIKRMFRQELTSEAMKRMEKKKRKHERKLLKQERKSLASTRKSRLSADDISLRSSISRSFSKSRNRLSSASASKADAIERENALRLSMGDELSRLSSDQAAAGYPVEDIRTGRGRDAAQGGSARNSFTQPRFSIDQALEEPGPRKL